MTDHCLPSDEFVGFMTSAQDKLRAYLIACVGNYNDANDILQKTNAVMLRKAKEFESESHFFAWAIATAKYEVLAHVRNRQRDRLTFSSDLTALIAEAAPAQLESISERRAALQECLTRLPGDKLQFIQLRYCHNLTLSQIGVETGRSLGAVKAMLVRLRAKLRDCIAKRLAATPEGVRT